MRAIVVAGAATVVPHTVAAEEGSEDESPRREASQQHRERIEQAVKASITQRIQTAIAADGGN